MARRARWCENNLYFLGGSARSQKRDADAIVGAGRVGRGLTKGAGGLVGAEDSNIPRGGVTRCHDDGNSSS